MASKTIGTILTLKDQMSPKLFKVSSNVKTMSKDMQRASKQSANMANKFASSVNKMVGKAAKVGAAFAGLAAAAIIKVGFEGLKELDEGVAKIKSIAGDIDTVKVRTELVRASSKTGVGVGELAEAQYSAISSGVSKENSLDAAVVAAKLSKAGFTDADSALKILTSTMNVYGLEGTAAMNAVSDKLLVTQNLGVTSVAELANSLGGLTPIAKSAGTSVDELMAGMAALTKNGLKTEEATTSLKGIMSSVIKPTAEAQKIAKSLGLEFSAAAIESKGFAGFLEDVKQKTGGNLDTMGKLFGNVQALSGALVLTGDGIEDFNTSLDAMKNSAGMTEQAYATMQNTLGAKLGKLKNIAKNTATSIMDTQSGAIGAMVDKMSKWVEDNEAKIQSWVEVIGNGIGKTVDFIRRMFEFIKKHQDVIIFIGTFVVAVSGLIKIMSVLKAAFGAVSVIVSIFSGALAISPIGWVIAAIAALVAVGVLLYKNWDTVKAKTIEVWNIIKEKVSGAWQSIKAAFSRAGDFFAEVWEKVKAPFIAAAQWYNDTVIQPVVAILSSIISKIGEIFSTIWQIIAALFGVAAQWFNDTVVQPLIGFFAPIVETIGGFFRGLWTGITEIFGSVVGWFSEKFTQAWEAIKAVFVPVGEFFAGVWETIKSMFTSIGTKIGEAVSGAFKAVVNAVLTFAESKINGFINGINAVVGMVNKLPGVSISRIAPLSIPKLAEGGIVTAPTLAMVGEGRENEAVIPLSKLDAMLSGKKERGGVTIGNITINARGVTADEVVREVVPKLKLALANI